MQLCLGMMGLIPTPISAQQRSNFKEKWCAVQAHKAAALTLKGGAEPRPLGVSRGSRCGGIFRGTIGAQPPGVPDTKLRWSRARKANCLASAVGVATGFNATAWNAGDIGMSSTEPQHVGYGVNWHKAHQAMGGDFLAMCLGRASTRLSTVARLVWSGAAVRHSVRCGGACAGVMMTARMTGDLMLLMLCAIRGA
ncbi:hypothetical protein CYMTET_30156 [Cymbomonas tetramitiformis]|uniref:Uncharacterized protein n=1 Tax=Cymbomonas tetramitiformis TaxID=36881 RepID=A0AAE0FJT2_9CHLO|nr:hypothetical protein CYMTET_30156 [Cymbomonas tetramitiformis]